MPQSPQDQVYIRQAEAEHEAGRDPMATVGSTGGFMPQFCPRERLSGPVTAAMPPCDHQRVLRNLVQRLRKKPWTPTSIDRRRSVLCHHSLIREIGCMAARTLGATNSVMQSVGRNDPHQQQNPGRKACRPQCRGIGRIRSSGRRHEGPCPVAVPKMISLEPCRSDELSIVSETRVAILRLRPLRSVDNRLRSSHRRVESAQTTSHDALLQTQSRTCNTI